MRQIHCPLCGYHFDPGALACHSHCPMNQSCGLICCPNCGYQIPDEEKSGLATWLRRRLGRWFSPPAPSSSAGAEDTGTCRLSELPPGTTARIVAISAAPPQPRRARWRHRGRASGRAGANRLAQSARLERLSLLGLVPGSRIRLEQRWPAIIVRVGETELSLDEDVAHQIIVTTNSHA